MIDLVVNIGGLAIIVSIIAWFWLFRPRVAHVAEAAPVDVVVADGVYTPSTIEVPAGKPITLRFLRRDASPCAAQVIFADLAVSADLPVGAPRDLVVTAPVPGEYEFTCQMGMYRGRLKVTPRQ